MFNPSFIDRPFASEAEMRDHIAANLGDLEPGLALHQRHPNTIEFKCSDVNGQPFRGRIDILASDRQGGLVVIECKNGTAHASALGQLLGYIAWLKAWFPSFQGRVRGFIVASSASPFLLRAIELVPDIQIRVYEHPSPSQLRRVI